MIHISEIQENYAPKIKLLKCADGVMRPSASDVIAGKYIPLINGILAKKISSTEKPDFTDQAPIALDWLCAKFHDAKLELVYAENCDNDSEKIVSILEAMRCEQICEACTAKDDRECLLSGKLKLAPTNIIEKKSFYGHPSFHIETGTCPRMITKTTREKIDFERMMKKSGLIGKQRSQTFETYTHRGLGAEITTAKSYAMLAAREGTWLVLAGQKGTGKSHLATAIAIDIMKKGRQAYFRLISEMLDNLRESNFNGSYYDKMQVLKEAPCLILDDMGKERSTSAGVEYLYQIIDYRYRHDLQTIATTNAKSREELISWGNKDYLAPIVSRFDEKGDWVFIDNAKDYRFSLRAQEKQEKQEKQAKV